MKINCIKSFVPLEKPFPKRSQRQWPLRQEHKCNFRNSLEGMFWYPRNKRSSPEQLFVTHLVKQIRRRPNPMFQSGRFIKARLIT
uniref:Uncharacterized protein n=1 Tax=Rhizophora mucronata TaxID=61149 RepID=A0A2P2J8G7_RHIMU